MHVVLQVHFFALANAFKKRAIIFNFNGLFYYLVADAKGVCHIVHIAI